jgi:PAS domain S-box-containing protein
MPRPKPVNKEIELNPKRYIVSKTDPKGVIEYGNDYFVEISGYKEHELIGYPHNIIRHPDMPKVIFKLMWERIAKGENIMALVKNLAKDGRFYWVVTEFEPKMDKLTNDIISYTAFRKAAPKKAVVAVTPLYKKLLEIEAEGGLDASEKYLRGFLEDKGTPYDKYIDKIVGNTGAFRLFFGAMKKIFA